MSSPEAVITENVVPEAAPVPSLFVRFLLRLDKAGQNYRLTRFMLLRFTGLVYFVAFLSAAQQFIPLIGHDGLLPADLYVDRVLHDRSPWTVFWQAPSVFWFNASDAMIQAVTWTGTVLSLLVLIGFANGLMLIVMWALYLSLIPIGQEWLGYGWDIQILETGFLGIMLSPLLDPRPFPKRAPPVVIVWLYRWLIFRIMLGAGLIKLRGDSCWRDLTALYYHYETQPVPNPLSRWLHFMPHWFQKAGVLWNHFVELVVPWFGFYGRHARHIAGVLMASFMAILIFSGNLSFLNWLTIIPCLACFDDTFWKKILPRFLVARADRSAAAGAHASTTHQFASFAYALLVVWLSIEPVRNLISSRQAMNTSFDVLHLVNTYGAFGSIDRERFELIYEGTADLAPDMLSDWREYEFKVKPGDPKRRPAIITPYHYRLDWAAWYPWTQAGGRNAWVPHFIWNLLHNDPGTLSLLAKNPFPDKPPRWIRVMVYRYKFAPPDNPDGAWWTRELIGTHIKPLSVESENLKTIVRQEGWLRDK
ncbi:lipase maturation factor family protein [Prosthecobacter sp.]|uniref:lipase maturation factor family protein n=1 Tax=Prosthecobacter sp. TaxID=1965333 RepID=UPI001D44F01B|nr:lipase maturation factor family protein [Prosthecobacter sp.]MCB1275094.1 lipase maturation factor family protein [Prosthecobacter sp.]